MNNNLEIKQINLTLSKNDEEYFDFIEFLKEKQNKVLGISKIDLIQNRNNIDLNHIHKKWFNKYILKFYYD